MDRRVAGNPADLEFKHRKGEIGDIGASATACGDTHDLPKDVAAETHIGFAGDRAYYTADFRRRVGCTGAKSCCMFNIMNSLGGDMQSVGMGVLKA
ncbi:unnamed protein product [Gongylonema pulchrum]|uniref:Pept_C1 domain-containing protein n=1 Tax=Gongylonema pulchrum TaxID=637853 RepID=A0A183DIB4_9BILA|nr:unnamed protein product [Gongylonema pulchrum]